MQPMKSAWRNGQEFCAITANSTCLWPRWLVLRAVGVVYVIIFAGIIDEGNALVGPHGIYPIAEFCATLRGIFPHFLERFLRAPSAFWISADPITLTVFAWGGIVAACALVLNLWPRLALFICWVSFLSFVATWQVFSSSIDDQLMLESALICIAFAPAGFQPGLGAGSPPRPIALFTLRWLLFRLMLGSGLIKLVVPDPHWRDLTPMSVMYETSPLPTILGYWDHHLPPAYHLFEIALTFVAEIVAPLAAVFGGRRGRWLAFFSWTAFQIGIQLTTSFGWLNLAAIALGILLLDDPMLAAAARRLKLTRLAAFLGTPPAVPVGQFPTPLRRYGLRVLLGAHCALTLYFTAVLFARLPRPQVVKFNTDPVSYVFRDFKSANAYAPYGEFPEAKYEIEFQGSNDGGRTWRAYEFKFKPQRTDRICRFVAPWFPRFEATLQLTVNIPHTSIMARTATLLLKREAAVMRLFQRDPFPERPPEIIRLPVYRFAFTKPETLRQTGDYWQKTYIADYGPAVILGASGEIGEKPYSLYEEAKLAMAVYSRGSEVEAKAALLDLITRMQANGAGSARSPLDYALVMAGAYLRLAGIYRFEHDDPRMAQAMANAIQFSDQLSQVANDSDYLRDKQAYLLENVLGPMDASDPPVWKTGAGQK